MRKIIPLLLSVIIAFNSAGAITSAKKCTEYFGTNAGMQEYRTENGLPIYADNVTSYLAYDKTDGLFIRIQSQIDKSGYLAEYYDEQFALQRTEIIPRNDTFPLYGGFYISKDYNFILSGKRIDNENSYYQSTADEAAAEEELILIEKYNKKWEKISETVFSDAFSYEPFSYGTARFCEINNYLFIRTSHSFKLCPYGNENVHHQANMMLQLDMETMEIVDAQMRGADETEGYVSHSLNQFVISDGEKLLALDQGDCYPRALVMFEYFGAKDGKFSTLPCEKTTVIEFPIYEESYRYTGVSVGGFDSFNDFYAVSYSITSQDKTSICIATIDKTSKDVTVYELAETNKQCTPFLTKISSDELMVLWQEDGKTCYMTLNKHYLSTRIFAVAEFDNAKLSDCAPLCVDGNVIWYAYSNNMIYFYSLNRDQKMYIPTTHVIDNNHDYVPDYTVPTDDGYYEAYCEKCKKRAKFKLSTEINILWSTEKNGLYTNVLPEHVLPAGVILYFKIMDESDKLSKLSVEAEPNSVTIQFNEDLTGSIKFNKKGEYSITFRDKYNPLLFNVFYISSEGPVTGDANGNGKVDARDYLLIKRAYFGTYYLSPEQIEICDITKNGKLDARDYILLKRIYFGTYPAYHI